MRFAHRDIETRVESWDSSWIIKNRNANLNNFIKHAWSLAVESSENLEFYSLIRHEIIIKTNVWRLTAVMKELKSEFLNCFLHSSRLSTHDCSANEPNDSFVWFLARHIKSCHCGKDWIKRITWNWRRKNIAQQKGEKLEMFVKCEIYFSHVAAVKRICRRWEVSVHGNVQR